MRKIATFGILALFLLSVVAAGAFAFPGEGEGKRGRFHDGSFEARDFEAMTEKRAEMRAERQTMVDEACEAGELAEDFEGPRVEWLEDNLKAVCQIHEERQNGADREMIKELAEELGLEKPDAKMCGHGRGMFRQSGE